jgi:hypothetical protein
VHSFETELLTRDENLAGLAAINRELIARVEAMESSRRVVLDIDSTEIPVYGQQEQSAYNGHFESTCYHPLLLFNWEGDCLAAKLRPGNVHSAEQWDQVLLPEIERQQQQGKDVVVRADAAFAKPEVCPPLEVDPFAGGGSMLEALRVGCETFASDLNPVACLILKVLLEDIPRHRRAKMKVPTADGGEEEVEGLAEAIRRVARGIVDGDMDDLIAQPAMPMRTGLTAQGPVATPWRNAAQGLHIDVQQFARVVADITDGDPAGAVHVREPRESALPEDGIDRRVVQADERREAPRAPTELPP